MFNTKTDGHVSYLILLQPGIHPPTFDVSNNLPFLPPLVIQIMRKTLKFALFISSFFIFNTAFAQKDWQWPAHGVGFSAPANLKVTVNNDDEFAAEGSDLVLSIQPIQDASLTADNLAEALVAAATELEYDDIHAASALAIDDFVGYFVEGTKDGVGAFIIMLLDTESSTNLIIVMAYTSDAGRTKAISIGDSFYAFD